MPSSEISHIVLMGDSLSDRGTMDHRHLLGFIPMDGLSGLKTTSPRGRFTNGFTWSDDIFVSFANEFGIKQLERDMSPAVGDELLEGLLDEQLSVHRRPKQDDTDIADALIDEEPQVKRLVEKSYSLNKNLRFDYEGQVLARSYAEGGLTAHDYSWSFISSITLFFSRLILSTLGKKRKELFADDKKHGITDASKAKTLVMEWSGANDLITVNRKPTHEEVDKAVRARIQNVNELIKHGYKHFVLFDLPNLGLTPRYKGSAGEADATDCCNYFNEELKRACITLAQQHPECSIDVFEVSKTFDHIYNNPEAHGFDIEKRGQAYTATDEFKIRKDRTSPAPGFMFWDGVHPSAHMHALLSDAAYRKYATIYNFTQPKVEPREKIKMPETEVELLAIFRAAYEQKFNQDKRGFLGFFKRSNIVYQHADLKTILNHALYNGGHRSFAVLKELGWLDQNKQLIPDNLALENALEHVNAAHDHQVAPLANRI